MTRAHSQAGLTLIEMMIATVLSGIIVITGIQLWQHIQLWGPRLETHQRQMAREQFLRDQLLFIDREGPPPVFKSREIRFATWRSARYPKGLERVIAEYIIDGDTISYREANAKGEIWQADFQTRIKTGSFVFWMPAQKDWARQWSETAYPPPLVLWSLTTARGRTERVLSTQDFQLFSSSGSSSSAPLR